MKPDSEGEYVEGIIQRQTDIPRSLPKGSLRRLYFLSPNCRYNFTAGLVSLGFEGLAIYIRLHPDRYSDSTSVAMMVGAGILFVIALVMALDYVLKIRRAIQSGVSVVGRVEAVRSEGNRYRNTYAGMTSGAIRAVISYNVNGLQRSSQLFLDLPWVRDVQQGTELRLLVDPDKSTILYVVGLAAQPRR